jgi:hypothetical protein
LSAIAAARQHVDGILFIFNATSFDYSMSTKHMSDSRAMPPNSHLTRVKKTTFTCCPSWGTSLWAVKFRNFCDEILLVYNCISLHIWDITSYVLFLFFKWLIWYIAPNIWFSNGDMFVFIIWSQKIISLHAAHIEIIMYIYLGSGERSKSIELKSWFEIFSSPWFCIKIHTLNKP